jgi:hypothetical protein
MEQVVGFSSQTPPMGLPTTQATLLFAQSLTSLGKGEDVIMAISQMEKLSQ